LRVRRRAVAAARELKGNHPGCTSLGFRSGARKVGDTLADERAKPVEKANEEFAIRAARLLKLI
jgi:hypothetical protein